MQDIVFYAAANETLGMVRDYTNMHQEEAPALTIGVAVCLRMRLFAGIKDPTPYPAASLSGITDWHWSMDSDFDRSTACKLAADEGGISVHTVTDTVNGETMSFTEFVRAAGKRRLAVLLDEGEPAKTTPFAGELTDLLKRYLVVGGMPEAVSTYVETNDFREVRQVQEEILSAYDSDFVKHAPAAMLPKIRLLWRSIPSQLARENKKFVYTALKSGARAREYESALQWLDDAGMIKQVFRVGTPRIPMRSYIDLSAFKLYAHDVGLLGALSELPPSAIVEGNALFTNFKGALTEQYVLQELLVAGYKPAYWTNDAGNAEVEFVVQGEKAVCPVEAKAGINTQAKSLKVYQKLFSPPFAIRTSLAGANDGSWIKDIPLYAFGPSIRQCCRLPL